MKFKFYFSFISIIVLLSCTKHRDDVEERIPVATINFSSPTALSIYKFGDSVSIEGIAISTTTVHGYDVIVKKANDTTKLFFQHGHDHNDTLFINKKWKNTITTPTDLEAQIILYLDHDGHTGTKKARFKVQ